MKTISTLILIYFASQKILADTHYVSPAGGNNPPYTSWATAAINIQNAVDEAGSGDIVLVDDGVYAAGGALTPGFALSNRVVVTTNITVESVNGPEVTIILGQSCNGTNGRWAVRCAFLITNAKLVGFTLSNGHTRVQGDYLKEQMGGGVYANYGSVLNNCIVSGNSADEKGGGIFFGYRCTAQYSRVSGNVASYGGGVHAENRSMLEYCEINGNVASNYGGGIQGLGCKIKHCTISGNLGNYGGGADLSSATLENSTISSNKSVRQGGGVNARFGTTIRDCRIIENMAETKGGGIYASPADAINCLIYKNNAGDNGGGVFANEGSELQNCTIVSNTSDYRAGGLHCQNNVVTENCIIYFNTAVSSGANYRNYGTGIYFQSCCTTPALTGSFNLGGNISQNPEFVDHAGGDFHLIKNSPCVDMGMYAGWMTYGTDLDGYARIFNGIVDMGAYEYSPLSPFGGISVRCRESKLKNKRRKGVLKCKSLTPLLRKYLTNGYGIGIWDLAAESNVDGPRPLTAKNKKGTVWIFKDKTDKTAKIIYYEKYNKKKHFHKTKLKYILQGGIPESNLVYIAPLE